MDVEDGCHRVILGSIPAFSRMADHLGEFRIRDPPIREGCSADCTLMFGICVCWYCCHCLVMMDRGSNLVCC